MSYTDYTRAKHFGSGIFLPYSEFIADVLVALDNMLASQPEFARFVTLFPTRDTILILGDRLSILAISRTSHRHYPLFATYKWGEFWATTEEDVIAINKLSLKKAQLLEMPDLVAHLAEAFSFVDVSILAVPSVFIAKAGSPEAAIRVQSISSAAKLLWEAEWRRYQETLEMEKPKEIFLSHKSADKGLVREVGRTLAAIGFSPWLDEDKMKAGANLERSIREGFVTSCAAVFFVTPSFSDEGYLATEIDYALAEMRAKGDRFAIITLLLRGVDGSVGTVPAMIQQYVWKSVEPVEVVRTIVEALPVKMEQVVWRR